MPAPARRVVSRARAARRRADGLRLRLDQPPAPLRLVGVPAARLAAPAPTRPGFDAERAFALLEAQCATGSRAAGSPGHRTTRALLLGELGRHADEVAVQTWAQPIRHGTGAGTTVPLTNVVGRIVGGGDRPRPTVLLGTHWDTRPTAEADHDPARRHEPAPGASDGASGVAVLLELARVLAVQRPPVDVVVACFDGEDLGQHCYGSRRFARTIRAGGAGRFRPDEAVVVDMVGGAGLRCTTDPNSEEQAPDLWQRVHRVAADLGVAASFGGPARRTFDDHVPLAHAGVPSVLLIDLDYPWWHTIGDTPERCSPASLEIVGRVLHRLVTDRAAR